MNETGPEAKRAAATKRPPMPSNYAQFYSRSHDAVIRVYDDAGNVIETHEHAGDFKEFKFRTARA
jgi:hypothetical protein